MTPHLGPLHWLVIFVALLIYGVPAAIILKRAGFSPAWLLLGIIPGVAPVGLWIFALARWPALSARDTSPSANQQPDAS